MGCSCCVVGGMLRGCPWEMRMGWQDIEMGAGSGLLLLVCPSALCCTLVKFVV